MYIYHSYIHTRTYICKYIYIYFMMLCKDIGVSIQISDIAHFKIGGFMRYRLES